MKEAGKDTYLTSLFIAWSMTKTGKSWQPDWQYKRTCHVTVLTKTRTENVLASENAYFINIQPFDSCLGMAVGSSCKFIKVL